MVDKDIIAATPEFRKRIIGVLIYTDWLTRYGCILLPEHFPIDAEKVLVAWINWHYKTYGYQPEDEAIQEGLITDDQDDALELWDSIDEEYFDDVSLDYVVDKALEFAQVQAMKVAILQSVDALQEGEVYKPLELVREAQQVGKDLLDLGADLIDDAEDWVYEELHGKRFPTGITPLDNTLGGGLVAGEYGLIMAPPGRGKSTMLVNIGYGLAGLVGAANVLHLTYEMPAQKVLKRYALRVANVRFTRGEGSEARYIKDLRETAKSRLRGRLRVIRPTDYTVDGIRRLIDSLDAEGWPTEALIVDYPDLMRPVRQRKELRFELADIARDLREIGVEYEMPVWGGTQAGRQSIYKDIIHIGDIAEAIEKAAIADVVLSICQTREEEGLGHGRLFLAKVRDAEDHWAIPINLNFGAQAITPRQGLDAIIQR